MVNDDFNIFFFGVFQFPVRSLEEIPRLTCHNFYVVGAQAQGGTAAIHCGIANTDDQHTFANAVAVFKSNRFQPGDADMDIGTTLFTAR